MEVKDKVMVKRMTRAWQFTEFVLALSAGVFCREQSSDLKVARKVDLRALPSAHKKGGRDCR